MRALSLALVVGVALASPVQAEIRRIVVDRSKSESPGYGGKSFGDAGRYERLAGLAYGELDPTAPRNALIQDVQLAPRNSRGMVEYVTAFSLIKPVDMARASGQLYYEIVNRGNEGTQRFLKGGDQDGEAFLMARGAVVLRSGWQGDIPPTDPGNWGGRTYSIQVPIARNPDGSSITGRILHQFVNVSGSTSPLVVLQRPVAYRPATLDTAQATLTSTSSLSNEGKTGPAATIPGTEWAWADCGAVKKEEYK